MLIFIGLRCTYINRCNYINRHATLSLLKWIDLDYLCVILYFLIWIYNQVCLILRKYFSKILKNRDPVNRKSLKIMSLKTGTLLKLNILELEK